MESELTELSEFTAFADETSATIVDGLTVENGIKSVSIYGGIEITRDDEGLEHARRLRTLLDGVISAIMTLPPSERAVETEPTVEIENPFA
jgi:hypothetical protein